MSETFSSEAITQIAHLARLGTSKPETQHKIQTDLNNIVKMVGQISRANTDGVEPMSHPFEMSQILRKDQVTEPNEREKMQKLTSNTEAGLYLVPIVIEEES